MENHRAYSTLNVQYEIYHEFKRICGLKNLKVGKVSRELILDWIAKNHENAHKRKGKTILRKKKPQ